MAELKELIKLYTTDPATGKAKFVDSFVANGKEYLIEQPISMNRWKAWRKIQVQLLFGLNVDEIFAQIRKAYDKLNQKNSETIEAGIILHNLMSTVKDIASDDRIPDVVQLCALFINTRDEDRGTITAARIKEKSDDWEKEGIDMQSFFLFAVNSIPNFQPIYEAISQNTSAE